MPRLLVFVGVMACLLDGLTTWAALSGGPPFHEATPATGALIASIGLLPALAVSVAVRSAAFALVGVAMERVPRLSFAFLALGLLAAGLTWAIVLNNIAAIASVR
jgi:hypothetical protein